MQKSFIDVEMTSENLDNNLQDVRQGYVDPRTAMAMMSHMSFGRNSFTFVE